MAQESEHHEQRIQTARLLILIFFGTIWGIIGMFLAVPITAVVKILLQRFGYTCAIADLFAGKTETC